MKNPGRIKKMISIVVITLITSVAFAQPETAISKTVANQFQEKYNVSDYEAVFSMFSPEMKGFMPHDKAIAFLQGLKSEAGDIKERNFVAYKQKGVAMYKTKFERILVALYISVDANSMINGLLVKPYEVENLPIIDRNTTKLKLPFKDEWTVFWGGDTKELNYHVVDKAQKNAFDFVITDEHKKTYKNEGKNNEDFYAFGKELLAPCDGEVILVVEGVPDNKPGVTNPVYVPGNTVIIKTAKNEFLFFAHFKQHSIAVKQGQKVKQGDLLGLCGNSGNSTEPHLHFHIQNVENMNVATGAKAYFEEILVNGELKKYHSPIRMEKIKNK